MSYRSLLATFCAAAAMISIPGGVGESPTPAPVPGPGGVYYAVEGVLTAIDAADSTALGAAFSSSAGGYEFGENGSQVGQAAQALSFWDGSTTADSSKSILGFAKSLAHPKLGSPSSAIKSLRADCPSGVCSWATFEFDRVWGSGDEQRVQEMRGTALMRYVSPSAKGPGRFEITHWHAAPR